MPIDLETKLCRTAARIFEDVCFLPSTREPAPAVPTQREREVGVRIGFDGVFRGALEITCPIAVATQLADAMLGGQPASAQQRLDAFGELANVVTGNLLPEMAGTELVFDVTAPAPLAGLPPLDGSPSARVRLRSDEGPIDLALHIEGLAPETRT